MCVLLCANSIAANCLQKQRGNACFSLCPGISGQEGGWPGRSTQDGK